MATRLADYLSAHPEFDLNDVAYTLQIGRSPFLSRQTLVCQDREEAIALLQAAATGPATQQSSTRRPVVLFFLDNVDRVKQSWELIAQEPDFQEILKEGTAFVRQQFKCTLADLLKGKASAERTRCASLLWSYGLAHLLQKWGVEVRAVGGEGTGSLAAIVVAGTLSLEEGLRLAQAQAQNADEKTLIQLLENSKRQKPALPLASRTRSGWLTETQAREPQELLRQLCAEAAPIKTLLEESEAIFLEAGPDSGRARKLLAGTESGTEQTDRVLAFFSETKPEPAQKALLRTLGTLWEQGAALNWKEFSAQEQRRRVPLPVSVSGSIRSLCRKCWPLRARHLFRLKSKRRVTTGSICQPGSRPRWLQSSDLLWPALTLSCWTSTKSEKRWRSVWNDAARA
jgi:acyl transferase domain-containing protein